MSTESHPGRITAQSSGVYMVTAVVMVEGGTAAKHQLQLLKNGQVVYNSIGQFQADCSFQLRLGVGEYIEIFYAYFFGDPVMTMAAGPYTTLTCRLLS